MTDISPNVPIAIRRPKPPRLSVPRLGIGALFNAMPGSLGGVFKMAYVDPYNGVRHPLQAVPDDDLEGRDPNW